MASPSVAVIVPKVTRFSFGVSEVEVNTGVLSLVSFTVTIIDCSELNTPSVTETTAAYDDCVSKSAPFVSTKLRAPIDDISISDPEIE